MKSVTRYLETNCRNKNQLYIYKAECKEGKISIDSHWHEDFEILYLLCDGVAELDTELLSFKQGQIVFVNKEQLHKLTARSDGTFFAIVFSFELLDFKCEDFCQREIIDALKKKALLFPQCNSLSLEHQEKIASIIKSIVHLYYSNIPGRELMIKCNLYEMIFLLYTHKGLLKAENAEHNSIQLAYVKKAIAYMEDNYSESITIDDLSKSISICKYHLIKIFKRLTGETPMIYLRNMRIDISKSFLTKGISVTETAFMSGFKNVSYYIRHFKAINHVSPKEYQKSICTNSN